jgi:hypothetical protein
MENDEENLPNDLNDNVEPSSVCPWIDKESERTKLRTLVADPICAKSNTDRLDPKYARPYKDSDEPQ